MSSTELDASVYARLRLAPFIKEAVQAAVVARPADTIDFMIQFLTKNKDKLQQGLIAEAIDYVNSGGKMENAEDEELLRQYAIIRKKLDAVTNVGRAEVARLKDWNNQAKQSIKELDAQLQLAQAELGDARARIAELEDQLAAAASAAPAPAVAAETAPQKLPVLDEIHSSGGSETAAAALEPGVQEHAAARTNPFHALSDIGLDERAAQLVALAGAHGYAIVFGADSAEGEPSARSQLVENAAAAMTAAGVSVAVHKLDISGMAGGSAFVVFGDDDSQTPGPFVASLQEQAAAAEADPATVIWLHLVGNNDTLTLENLKSAVFSQSTVQTVTGDVRVPHNVHVIVETAEEENLPLPCFWVKI